MYLSEFLGQAIFLLCCSLLSWRFLDQLTYTGNEVSLASPRLSLDLPDLATASIENLSAHLSRGSFTSVDLVTAYERRIRELNPIFCAVSEVNPDAYKIASSLDRERSQGRIRGPLHGIPILLKDNIATADKLNNTAGSYALLGARVSREATVATKLRDAGAIILGKSSMGEWAQFRSFSNISSRGWSAYGGQTLGVYYPHQDPHGSSSGSATAVALGMAAAAIGTETMGSIVNPSSNGNLVGIKPTVGLTSRNMVIPISKRQDTVGPMTRTTKDAAIILDAMAGMDPHDNWTLAQPATRAQYAHTCNSASLKGMKIGIPRNAILPLLDREKLPIMKAFENAVEIMATAGAIITDSADFTSFDVSKIIKSQDVVLDTDFVADIRDYLSKLVINPNNIWSLEDLVEYTTSDVREEVSGRGIHAWELAMRRNITDSSWESWEAYQNNILDATSNGITGALKRYSLDALVMPTFASFYLTAIGGLPSVTVPLGFYSSDTPIRTNTRGTTVEVGPDIPFGISFVGGAWSEETLILLAHAFEELTEARKGRDPYILPQTTLEDIISRDLGASLFSQCLSQYQWPEISFLKSLTAFAKKMFGFTSLFSSSSLHPGSVRSYSPA